MGYKNDYGGWDWRGSSRDGEKGVYLKIEFTEFVVVYGVYYEKWKGLMEILSFFWCDKLKGESCYLLKWEDFKRNRFMEVLGDYFIFLSLRGFFII